MFTVEDNVDKGRHSREEILVKRNAKNTTFVWKLSFEELVELQTTISTYIAGERG